MQLGPLTVYVWGLCVAIGIAVATWVAARKYASAGGKEEQMWDMAFWVILGALIGARLFEAVYNPGVYIQDPLEIVRLWHGGFSETGGILGAGIAVLFYMRRHKQIDRWQLADCAAYALPLGFGIGRIGCFLIHDHPGTLTHSMLGVQYPDGVRHDLGLDQSIEGFLLFALFFWLAKKKQAPGTFVWLFFMLHACTRFFLDFIRINDVRYIGLTPAQWVACAVLISGTAIAIRWRSRLFAKK